MLTRGPRRIIAAQRPLQVRIKVRTFAPVVYSVRFRMQKKTIEAIVRVAIAVLSALLGALAQTSCQVLPHDAASQLLGNYSIILNSNLWQ